MAFLGSMFGILQNEGLLLGGLFGLLAIAFIVGWIVGSFFLYIGLGVAGVPPEERGFGSVMITTLLVSLVQSFIPLVGCILAWWIIKVRHTDSWGGAIVAWLVAMIIPIIIIIAIVFLFYPGIISTYPVSP
ncbi:MAG: hypothetical protein ACP6IP_03980 [Candidatus Njordarchaeia archaeon]